MKFINAAVISFVLTISAWKCGQTNAAPGFWDSDTNNSAFDNNAFHNDYKPNQFFEPQPISRNDKVELGMNQNVKSNQAFEPQPIFRKDKVELGMNQNVKGNQAFEPQPIFRKDQVELGMNQNVKGNQFFEPQSISRNDKVELDKKPSAKDLNQGIVASEDGVFHEVRNQNLEYGHIKPTLVIMVNNTQTAAALKPPTHKLTGFWNRVFGPGEIKDPFSATTNQKISYNDALISDGPVVINSNQSS